MNAKGLGRLLQDLEDGQLIRLDDARDRTGPSQALEYHREGARLLEATASAVPDDRLRNLFRQREAVAREFEAAV